MELSDYPISNAWKKSKCIHRKKSSSMKISMDNVKDGIKSRITERIEFECRLTRKATPIFVFFCTEENPMQEAISKIAQLKLLLQILGAWLQPWWMK